MNKRDLTRHIETVEALRDFALAVSHGGGACDGAVCDCCDDSCQCSDPTCRCEFHRLATPHDALHALDAALTSMRRDLAALEEAERAAAEVKALADQMAVVS